ncbi:MAG: ABC transporter ATP-binding protein [Prochloraceae cyanobacterium]
MSEIVIETKNLTRDFNKNLRAVDNISFKVNSREIFGFLGTNGSGKTTTIHLLLGILKPTRGTATVLGFDSRSQGGKIRSRTGVLLEHNGLYENISAVDNLEFYGRAYRLSAKTRSDRQKELLCNLGLWERRHDKVGKWSKGMKQKLAIARTLLHRPALIFLDEPTSGLDPMAATALWETLTELVATEGVTIFLNTHNLPEAEKWCDRVAIIRQGKLLGVGRPQELKSGKSNQKVEITGKGFAEHTKQLIIHSLSGVQEVTISADRLLVELDPQGKVAPLVTLLVNNGYAIETVNKTQETLENLFLNLVKE